MPALPDTPALSALFNDIAGFVYDRLTPVDHDGPAAKRRRVDIAHLPAQVQHNGRPHRSPLPAASQTAGVGADAAAAEAIMLEIKDVSVTAPQRKKYDLCFTKNFLYARAPGSSVPVHGIVYPWKALGAAQRP